MVQLIDSANEGNVVLSPLSVRVVLTALYGGASGNTSKQLERALDLGAGYGINATVAHFASTVHSLQVISLNFFKISNSFLNRILLFSST